MKWQLKAAAQGIFGALPWGHRLNLLLQEKLGELRHFDARAALAPLVHGILRPAIEHCGSLEGARVVEIGTGWRPTLPSALGLLGASVHTFDVVRHLSPERARETLVQVAGALPSALADAGIEHSVVTGQPPITYTAPADTTALPLDSDSQQLAVSNLVLQHVRPERLPSVLAELSRVLEPGAVSIHRINLHDEYASVDPTLTSINFLRYPAWFWERFGQNRIKYVNRARYPHYLRAFRDAGFELIDVARHVDERALARLAELPIDSEFADLDPETLCTVSLRVVAKKRRTHETILEPLPL
jgi:hypothetical protein